MTGEASAVYGQVKRVSGKIYVVPMNRNLAGKSDEAAT